MRRKSLRNFVQILLLVLVLGTSSNAFADTIAITEVSLSNLQIIPTTGTVVISPPLVGNATAAGAAAINTLDDEGADFEEGPTRSEANTSITFATVNAVSDFTTLALSANTNVMLPGCRCEAETEANAALRLSFMIVGGTGPVDVTLSALTETLQNLVRDQFSTFAVSEIRITLNLIGVETFSFDSLLRIGPNEMLSLETQRLISEVVTLQFNQEYNLLVHLNAVARAGENEIPEPATVFLLVSGLGFMAGVVKKRRAMR